MDLVANLVGLLAIIVAALTGIAGIGILAARRKNLPVPTTKDRTAERNTHS
ncbi:hypothetical protein ACFVU2_01925 [Leifsonia sp. NPDC058194]|uniref:hypothetical protein n=1 Tax=Leifsonia sp. NPDC058194 TaxID=3346374 RepID=UPI0036DDEA5F